MSDWTAPVGKVRQITAWYQCPGLGRNRPCLPPTWTAEELGKRTNTPRFFGRVFCFFRLQRPPLSGWTAIARQVALTYAATWVIALAAYQSARPDLIRSPTRVLAHPRAVPLSLATRRIGGMRPRDQRWMVQTKPGA